MKNLICKLGAIALTSTLAVACGPANNGENNGTNNGGTNNGMTNTTDCSAAPELTREDVENGGTLEAGSCYLVNERLTVGGELVVEEGVVLQFAENIDFRITGDGRLNVQGTADEAVIFQGQDETKGYWKGIFVGTSGSANNLEYLVVEHAGSSQWSGANYSTASINVPSEGGLTISNTTVREGLGNGILVGDTPDFAISGSTVTTTDIPLHVYHNVVGNIAADNDFTGNGDDRVYLGFGNSDSVDSEQTWEFNAVPYRATNRWYITSPLTLMPGVEIQFAEDASVIVNDEGRITAVGTEDEQITFTGDEETRGYWKGIQVNTGGSANVFDYVNIEYSGGQQWSGASDSAAAVHLGTTSELHISNSTFLDNAGRALHAGGQDVDISGFAGNSFIENEKPIHVHTNLAGEINADTVFTDNDEQAVRVAFGNSDAVRDAQTWQAIEVPFLVTNRTYVKNALNIDAGTTIQFLEDASMIIDDEGSISANGEAGNEVVFTGEEETVGFWKGLGVYTTTADNVLTHTVISYAGSSQWTGATESVGALYVTGSLKLDNVSIENSGGFAISASNDAGLDCSGMSYSGNADGDLYTSDGILTCL